MRLVDLVGRPFEEQVGAVGVLEGAAVAAPPELTEQPAPLPDGDSGVAHPQVEVVDGAAHAHAPDPRTPIGNMDRFRSSTQPVNTTRAATGVYR